SSGNKIPRLAMKQLIEIAPSGAELWVVASGKGGVGKSLISLGLVEDLSRNGKVLLLDFDLHNCGLTSLLDLGNRNSPNTAYSLLEDFRKMLEAGSSGDETYKSILEDDYQLPQSFDSKKHLNIILEKYAKECRLDPHKWSDLTEDSLLDPELIRISPKVEKIRVKREDSALIPRNAFILPSRNYKQQLLLTPVSTLSYIVVFLFLRALCYWMAVRSTVGTIILDCHGAHDAFTAASMLAAQKLVVVTTTDPGCFNGTLELLNAVEERAKLRMSTPVDTAIVFNSCHALGEQLPEVITNSLDKVQPKGVV